MHIVCTAYTVQPVLFIRYRLGNVYASPKKDTVMFRSPQYVVKTSYRLYVLTVCLIHLQVWNE